MSHACEVRIQGRTEPLRITLPDSVNADDPAAVRTYVEGEISHYYLDTRHLAPGEIRYDIYVDHDNNATTAMRRLGASTADGRTTGTIGATGAGVSRLWMNVTSIAGRPLTATIADASGSHDLDFDMDPNTEGVQKLVEISYTSDGDDRRISPEEMRSAYNDLRGRFASGPAGEEQFRQFYIRNPMIRFGSRDDQRMPLHSLMSSIGERAPGTMGPTGTVGGAPGSADGSDPGSPDSIINSYLSNPSAENLQRLRADRAATERLIARLLAALEQGNLDVLMPLMDAVAKVSNSTVAEIGARVARILGASDTQAAEIGQRLSRVNTTSTNAAERGRASQDLQTFQLQLQQNTQARQQITGMLQSTMEMARSISETTRELRQADQARRRAGLGG